MSDDETLLTDIFDKMNDKHFVPSEVFPFIRGSVKVLDDRFFKTLHGMENKDCAPI